MNKILTIIDKEWAEVFKNRVVLFTVVQMPPVFTRMCGDARGTACMQIFIIYQFMLLFMMLPLAIPVAISAYSIVGEKTTRSLEPLLATPITTGELILGKALAAAIPAIVATWVGFLI